MRRDDFRPGGPITGPAKRIGGSLFEWNPDRAEIPLALRASVGVSIALAVGLLWPQPGLSAAAATGAWSAGITLLVPGVRPRPSLPLLAGLAVGVAVLFGGVAAPFPVATVLVAAGWAWLMAFIGSLGSAVGAVTTVCGVAFVLAPSITDGASPLAAATAAFIGGALQATAALLPPWRRNRPERNALAAAYRALAADARDIANDMDTPLSTQPFLDVQKTVGERRKVPQPLREAVGQLYELRAAIIAVAAARARIVGEHPTTGRHVARVLRSAATALDTMAHRVEQLAETDHDWEERLTEAIDAAPGPGDDDSPVRYRVAGQEIRRLHRALHRASRLAERVADGEPATRVVSRRVRMRTRLSEDWQTLRTYLDMDSPAMRHAWRAAATIAAATGIGLLWPSDHGHWIALTAWIVLRSDFAATIGRGLQRVLGTAAGAALASGLTLVLVDDPIWTAVAVGVFAVLGYLTMPVSFVVFSAAVAGFAVFQIDLAGQAPIDAAWERGAATAIGGGLALLFFALWPTWQTRRLPDLLADLIEAYGRYARLVLRSQAFPEQRDEPELLRAVDAIRLARSKLSAAADQAAAEPVWGPRPWSADVLDAEATLSRAARALIVLEGSARHDTEGELPGVARFADSIGDAYHRLAARARGGDSLASIDLDDALADLDESLSDGPSATKRRRRVLDWETDILTEAVSDTALIVNGWRSDS